MPSTLPPSLLSRTGTAPANVKPGGVWEQRSFPPHLSDGLESKWPVFPYRGSDQRNYLIKLAQSWAEKDGSARPGVNYYLETLPQGYGLFEIDQPGGPQTYRRLFGHPSGRFYDSIVRFEKHFFWLLNGRQGLCQCRLCGNVKPTSGPPKPKNPVLVEKVLLKSKPTLRQPGPSSIPHIANSGQDDVSSRSESASGTNRERERRGGRQISASYPIDEEGTKNEYKVAIIQAHNNQDSLKDIDYDIREEDSIDWVAEQEILARYLTQIELQHSFVPRRGELVLWCPDFPEKYYLLRDMATGVYQFFDFNEARFVGFPRWRAGIVTAVPSAASKNGPIDFPDILDIPQKKTSVNTAGFRIETMPDPNDDFDKSLSKQYRYVPLRHIRPLSHWQMLLRGIPQKDFHRSILHALTCMTSISLVQRTRFIGHWDRGGYISAKACYLGSELITIGDTIRLKPESRTSLCTDILVVDSIRLRMAGFRPEHVNSDALLSCSSLQIHFVGRAFTTNIKRAHGYPTVDQTSTADAVRLPLPIHHEDIKYTFRPVGTAQYGEWYLLHAIDQKYDVSYDEVLGRLYEADAVRLWSGQRQQKAKTMDGTMPDLGFDATSIIAGRKYATKTDERIPDVDPDDPDGIRWLLSENRAQALAIASVNGLEVAAYHEIRTLATLADWRAHIRIAEGKAPNTEAPVVKKPERNRPRYYFGGVGDGEWERKRGRKPGSKVIDGKVYSATMLAKLSEMPRHTKPPKKHSDDEAETEVLHNEEDLSVSADQSGFEIEDSQPTFKHSSQMAGAALDSTDEDDILGGYDEDDGEEPDIQVSPDQRRSLKSRLAAYDDFDDFDDDGEEDELVSDELRDALVSDWQTGSSGKPGKRNTGTAPNKSQIMESVEDGDDSALEAVQAYDASEEEYDDYDEDDSLKDWDIEKWKQVQSARGGTEETEGGDYEPEETQ